MDPCKNLDLLEDILELDLPSDAIPAGAGSNSPAMNNQLLLKAAQDGHISGIRCALGLGASVDTRRPFMITPQPILTESKAKPSRCTGLTPLMYAAHGGYAHACELLLNACANVNSEDEDGMQPLHFAAMSGSSETCTVLIRHGARTEAMDDDGRLPMSLIPGFDSATRDEKRSWQSAFQTAPSALEQQISEDSKPLWLRAKKPDYQKC